MLHHQGASRNRRDCAVSGEFVFILPPLCLGFGRDVSADTGELPLGKGSAAPGMAVRQAVPASSVRWPHTAGRIYHGVPLVM